MIPLALRFGLLLIPSTAAAEPQWRLLRQTEVQASSFLKSNWNKYSENYHPNYIADDNPATAWVEGVAGNGEGQVVMLPTSPLREARSVKVEVRNGYQKSEALLKANAAPKDVRVVVWAGGQPVAQVDATLERKMGWQDILVPLPPGAGVSEVRLEVVSVHPGATYKDTCISDVRISADTDVAYRAAIEEARFQRLVAWTAERRKTAAYFASLPATYPFASTAFDTETVDEGDEAQLTADVLALAKEAKAASTAGSWWKRASTGPDIEPPDNLWMLRDLAPLLEPGRLAWFESEDRFATKRRESFDYGYHETHRTNAKVRFADAANTVPATIWFELQERGEERGPYQNTRQVYIQCDDKGRPETILVDSQDISEMGPQAETIRYTLHRNASGQVDRVDSVLVRNVDPAANPHQEGRVRFERSRYVASAG